MAPPQIGLSILRVGIFPVANAEIVRRRRHHQIDAFVRQSRHSFDAIFSAKIEPGHGEKCRAIMRVVQALNHTRPFSGEHRAASLLSSAACRRLPRLARIPLLRTLQKLFGRLPKRTGWQPCAPQIDIRAFGRIRLSFWQWRTSLRN